MTANSDVKVLRIGSQGLVDAGPLTLSRYLAVAQTKVRIDDTSQLLTVMCVTRGIYGSRGRSILALDARVPVFAYSTKNDNKVWKEAGLCQSVVKNMASTVCGSCLL